MNLSYSTAILQDRAWRLWAAEQLVLIAWLPVAAMKETEASLVQDGTINGGSVYLNTSLQKSKKLKAEFCLSLKYIPHL